MGQLDIQSQPYEGLNSKCLARIYANKNYTTSGGSGSRKRTHTNTKASKNYATKPPDEEPLTNILGSSGPTHPPALRAAKAALRARGGAPWGGAALRSTTNRDVEHFHSLRPAGHYGVPGCVRIALEGLWGYWLTYRKISEKISAQSRLGNPALSPSPTVPKTFTFRPSAHSRGSVYICLFQSRNKINLLFLNVITRYSGSSPFASGCRFRFVLV